ncbi:hypothetical protein [Nocardia aurea]|uniref:Lipoprotein n=1 Tax=Nocardia aurea TaxID=2144174 RepID=A0ABV3FZ41_9NOCA
MVLVAVVSLYTAGCGFIAAPDRKSDSAACVSEYRFIDNNTLGSMLRFTDRANAAAAEGNATTLREIGRSVGWRDGWDRIVDVPQDITAAELDRRTGTSGICWKSLPKRVGSEYDGSRRGEYLFLEGDRPIQSIPWFEPGQRPFDFQGRDQIFADTLLVGTQNKTLRPE